MTATAAPLPARRRHRSAFSIGVAVVALAGVPAIWLPFGYGIHLLAVQLAGPAPRSL